MSAATSAIERRDVAGWVLFGALIAAACLWVLSLPVFPSQDGAAHVYYAKVSRELLLGHAGFDQDFRIARPFPPYSVHAYLLMSLLQCFSGVMAEKLLACICVLVGGFGLAYLARQVGRSASVVACLAVPFLLHRWIFFGFYGYAIGVGLALLAIGLWMRSAGRGRVAFLVVTALTLFAHPVPYLVINGFCWSELLWQWWNARREQRAPKKLDLLTLIAASAMSLYILGYSQSGMLWNYELLADVRDKLFRIIDVFRTWNTLPVRAGLYNVAMASVLIGAVAVAYWKARVPHPDRLWKGGHRASSQGGQPGAPVLVWGFLLLVALPFLPRTMNGSGFFADRFSIWPPLLWFAAAASVELSRRMRTVLQVAAVILTVLTLLTLDAHIRPLARDLDPSKPPQFGLKGQHVITRSDSRVRRDLTFDPYVLAALRVVDREGAILVDSPWMDLQIMMLEEKGPKVKFDADAGLRIVSGPPAEIAMVFTRCGDVRGESVAEHLERRNPGKWRLSKYGCIEVLQR